MKVLNSWWTVAWIVIVCVLAVSFLSIVNSMLQAEAERYEQAYQRLGIK